MDFCVKQLIFLCPIDFIDRSYCNYQKCSARNFRSNLSALPAAPATLDRSCDSSSDSRQYPCQAGARFDMLPGYINPGRVRRDTHDACQPSRSNRTVRPALAGIMVHGLYCADGLRNRVGDPGLGNRYVSTNISQAVHGIAHHQRRLGRVEHDNCLALPCLALPCLALPCLALPCLALPCLASRRLLFQSTWTLSR
jgi:hypothetical protein